MLSCKQASRMLSDRQEQRLTLGQRGWLRLHLLACAECRRFERQLLALRRALRKANDEQGDCEHAQLAKPARQRIERRLKQAASDEDKRP